MRPIPKHKILSSTISGTWSIPTQRTSLSSSQILMRWAPLLRLTRQPEYGDSRIAGIRQSCTSEITKVYLILRTTRISRSVERSTWRVPHSSTSLIKLSARLTSPTTSASRTQFRISPWCRDSGTQLSRMTCFRLFLARRVLCPNSILVSIPRISDSTTNSTTFRSRARKSLSMS